MSLLLLWMGVVLLWLAFVVAKASHGRRKQRRVREALWESLGQMPVPTEAELAARRLASPRSSPNASAMLGGTLRPLGADELAGLTVNLYAARGFRLLRQELASQGGELLFESPSRSHVLVRCIPSRSAQAAGALERPDANDPRNLLRHTVLVTEGGFPEAVKGWAGTHRLELVDGPRLLQLLHTHLPGAAEALRLVERH